MEAAPAAAAAPGTEVEAGHDPIDQASVNGPPHIGTATLRAAKRVAHVQVTLADGSPDYFAQLHSIRPLTLKAGFDFECLQGVVNDRAIRGAIHHFPHASSDGTFPLNDMRKELASSGPLFVDSTVHAT